MASMNGHLKKNIRNKLYGAGNHIKTFRKLIKLLSRSLSRVSAVD